MNDATDNTLPRKIGVWGGAAIMIGVMIGSGIFRTPTDIANNLGNPALILAFWATGGLVALFGALTFAELATMYPSSGGLYVYLHKGYGPMVAFVFGWVYLLLVQPTAVAGITTVCSQHILELIEPDVRQRAPLLDHRIITCLIVVALTAINISGMKKGAGVAVFLTAIKVLALVAIVVLPIALMKGSAGHFTAVAAPKPLLWALAPVMAAVMWTYDGWSDTAAVAEEITEPQRRIPRIFLLGNVGMMLLYVAVNAAYIALVPLGEMAQTETVAPLVLERLVGPVGGTIVTVMIIISTLGAAHASIIVGSRVVFAQSRDRLLFDFVSRVHPRFQTPAVALGLICVLSCVVTFWLETFDRLIETFIFTLWIFYGMAGVAIFILRKREPGMSRPYRCWGYPVVPAVFVLVAAFMTVVSILESPGETLPWMALLAAGVPTYYAWRSARRRGAD